MCKGNDILMSVLSSLRPEFDLINWPNSNLGKLQWLSSS